jgi:hypothetical protein
MKKVIILIFMALSAVSPNILSAVPRQALTDLANAREYNVVRTKSQLPSKLRHALAKSFKQKYLDMADAGKPFAQTDFAIRHSDASVLPTRRLLFAFGTPTYFVVYYESNDVGLGANALIFQISASGNATFVWGGVEKDYADLAKSPRDLVSRLQQEKLIDDRHFIW